MLSRGSTRIIPFVGRKSHTREKNFWFVCKNNLATYWIFMYLCCKYCVAIYFPTKKTRIILWSKVFTLPSGSHLHSMLLAHITHTAVVWKKELSFCWTLTKRLHVHVTLTNDSITVPYWVVYTQAVCNAVWLRWNICLVCMYMLLWRWRSQILDEDTGDSVDPSWNRIRDNLQKTPEYI